MFPSERHFGLLLFSVSDCLTESSAAEFIRRIGWYHVNTFFLHMLLFSASTCGNNLT